MYVMGHSFMPAVRGRHPEPHSGRVRLGWLDGMRGLAALQVVLLHYTTAFEPGAVGLPGAPPSPVAYKIVDRTPLFFLLNGTGAVELFFLLSGVVLTLSFERQPFALPLWLSRRIIRLGLPMAAAIGLGFAVLAIWPHAHVAASRLTGSSTWLGSFLPSQLALRAAVHQIAFEGMLFGYLETSLLPHWMTQLTAITTLHQSYDTPLWTLHIEFVGSVMIMILVIMRMVLHRALHFGLCACLCVATLTSPLLMFVIGHLAVPVLRGKRKSKAWLGLGAGCLLIGLLLASGHTYKTFDLLFRQLPLFPTGPARTALSLQWRIAEVFIFSSAVMLPVIQRFLSLPTIRWLGRLSFSLYLVHFPILFTFVSALFLCLSPFLRYDLNVIACTCCGGVLTLLAAMAFERWIDMPAIRASHALRIGMRPARPPAAKASGLP